MRKKVVRLFAPILVVGVLAIPARADVVLYAGTTVGQATWNRPVENGGLPPVAVSSLVGTAVPFSVQPFYVTASGNYDFLSVATTPANWDNYTFLYVNSFDPTAPLTNVLLGNDDFPSVGRSGFANVPLLAGRQYYFVTTGFANTDQGAFTNTITGAGSNTAVLGTIPEPSSLALFGVSAGCLLGWRLRRGKPRA